MIRDHLVAVWRLVQHDAVDRFVRRVQHTDSKPIVGVCLDCIRHVERERRFAALMPTDADSVEPDIGLVVDGPETKKVSSFGVRIVRRVEIMPIPCNTVVAGEGTLDDPGAASGLILPVHVRR